MASVNPRVANAQDLKIDGSRPAEKIANPVP
jgi:hypothetical protein